MLINKKMYWNRNQPRLRTVGFNQPKRSFKGDAFIQKLDLSSTYQKYNINLELKILYFMKKDGLQGKKTPKTRIMIPTQKSFRIN